MARPTSRTAAAATFALLALAGSLPAAGNAVSSDDDPASEGPEAYDFSGPYSRVLTPGPYTILPPELIVLDSDLDGEAIRIGLHRPDTDERVPVLLLSGPYFYDGAWTDVTARESDSPVFGRHETYLGNLVANFAPHGYAVVGLAIRGTGGSGGCNDLMGPEEQADIDQALTWLGGQPWSSGAIGMTGLSYDGSTPWTAAATGNPHLKTIAPAAGVVDLYDLVSRNGTSEARLSVIGEWIPAGLNLNYYVAGAAGSEDAAPGDVPERLACPAAILGLAAAAQTAHDGTDPSGYWAAREHRSGILANYRGSVFAFHGLQDDNVPQDQSTSWVDQLERSGLRTKQIYHQGEHIYPGQMRDDGHGGVSDSRADYAEMLLRWLDRELKGANVDTGPAVQVRDDAGRWRNESHYPPRDVVWTTYHLGGGALAAGPGARESVLLRQVVAANKCAWDWPEASGPGEVADFFLDVSARDLLVVGAPKVHVAVTPAGASGSIGAVLCERAPDGSTKPHGTAGMDLAFAAGGHERREMVPGETIQAKLEIEPLDAVVRAGRQLFLRVWTFSGYDGRSFGPTLPVTLELGAPVESVLRLPTVERGPEVYFVPPMP